MEDKKMPFAVFVLKYVENMIKDYKELGQDEFKVLEELAVDCHYCPLQDHCFATAVNCKNKIQKCVESAE